MKSNRPLKFFCSAKFKKRIGASRAVIRPCLCFYILTGISSILFQKLNVTIKGDVFIDERFEVFAVLPDVLDDLASQLHVVPTDGLVIAVQLICECPEQTVSETAKYCLFTFTTHFL